MKNKKAFTLIELLVAILIIGILAAVALPQYKRIRVKTEYATLKNFTKSFYQSQKNYYLANNKVYAKTFASLDMGNGANDKKMQDINKDAYCVIEKTYLYCHNPKLKLSYLVRFENGHFYCIPYDDNKLSLKICKEETGHEPDRYGWYPY